MSEEGRHYGATSLSYSSLSAGSKSLTCTPQPAGVVSGAKNSQLISGHGKPPGGPLGLKNARMCVSKSEGNGFFFRINEMK